MDEKPQDTRGLFRVEDVPWEEFTKGRFGSRFRHLSSFGGGSRVGVAIEELEPGMQSNQFHYHIHEEEQVWILDGCVTLRLGENTFEMKAGDYVVFSAGQKEAHCFINNSGAVCRWMIVGDNLPSEVAIFPDTQKVTVREIKQVFDLTKTLDYWDREKID